MGGKIWSREEESAFWTVIIPSSNKRLLMDRPSAQNPRGWTQLAATMQSIMAGSARRRYTPLMLYEHFFQNAVLESFSPSARPFVQAYISEECFKPSERSRNPVRAAPSAIRAPRQRTIANRLLSADSQSSIIPAEFPQISQIPQVSQLPGISDDNTVDSSLLATELASPANGSSFLSPELEAEVSNRLSSSSSGLAGLAAQRPLPPFSDMYQPKYYGHMQYSTHSRSQNHGLAMHQQPYHEYHQPPVFGDQIMHTAQSQVYGHYQDGHQLFSPQPSVFEPMNGAEWSFAPDGVSIQPVKNIQSAQSVEAAETVQPTNSHTTNFDSGIRLRHLASVAASQPTVQSTVQSTSPPCRGAPTLADPASPALSSSSASSFSSAPSTPAVSSESDLATTELALADTNVLASTLPFTPDEPVQEGGSASGSSAPKQQSTASQTIEHPTERSNEQPNEQNQVNKESSQTSSGQDNGLFVPRWK